MNSDDFDANCLPLFIKKKRTSYMSKTTLFIIALLLAMICASAVDTKAKYCSDSGCEPTVRCIRQQGQEQCGTGKFATTVSNACSECGGSFNGCNTAFNNAGCQAVENWIFQEEYTASQVCAQLSC